MNSPFNPPHVFGPGGVFGVGTGGKRPIIFDQFTAANGTLLAGRTPAPTNNGNTWTVTSQTCTIQNNRAEMGGTTAILTIDAGVEDVYITSNWLFPSDTSAGIMFRYLDGNNYWFVRARLDNDTFEMYSNIGGAFTQRAVANTPALDNSTIYPMTLRVKGAVATATFAGVTISYGSVTTGRTIVGVRGGAAGVSFDDYKVFKS